MKKDELIRVFDQQALAYDSYRPRYPKQLIGDLLELSEWESQDKMLEIGCGTGQLTLDLLEKGCKVLAIERGPNLANLAHKHMFPFPNGRVIQARFEDWDSASTFKLVVSAQAFHWIDREEGVKKVLSHLEKEGLLALIWNLDVSYNSEFWKQTSPIYKKYFPPNPTQKRLNHVSLEFEEYLGQHPAFKELKRKEYAWEKRYTKEQYLGLLRTFSDHMTLDNRSRLAFFEEMGRTIEANGNQVGRSYKTVLLLARSKSAD